MSLKLISFDEKEDKEAEKEKKTYQKKKVVCPTCNVELTTSSFSSHKRSNKHLANMKRGEINKKEESDEEEEIEEDYTEDHSKETEEFNKWLGDYTNNLGMPEERKKEIQITKPAKKYNKKVSDLSIKELADVITQVNESKIDIKPKPKQSKKMPKRPKKKEVKEENIPQADKEPESIPQQAIPQQQIKNKPSMTLESLFS